jgi:hypothetical protein
MTAAFCVGHLAPSLDDKMFMEATDNAVESNCIGISGGNDARTCDQ